MADVFFGIENGATQDSVTTGATTTSKGIELRVAAGQKITKQELFRATEALLNFIKGRLGSFEGPF